MQRPIAKIAAPLLRLLTVLISHLTAILRGIREWLFSLLARGRRLRVSLDEIRVIGARLRREPLPRGAANSNSGRPVALTGDARQALKPTLKGGARLKNEV